MRRPLHARAVAADGARARAVAAIGARRARRGHAAAGARVRAVCTVHAHLEHRVHRALEALLVDAHVHLGRARPAARLPRAPAPAVLRMPATPPLPRARADSCFAASACLLLLHAHIYTHTGFFIALCELLARSLYVRFMGVLYAV